MGFEGLEGGIIVHLCMCESGLSQILLYIYTVLTNNQYLFLKQSLRLKGLCHEVHFKYFKYLDKNGYFYRPIVNKNFYWFLNFKVRL